MNEVSHLATDKDIVSIWSGIINVVYLLIAGVIGGFLTNWWKRKKYLLDKQRLEYVIELSRNKIEADKKSLRQQMITNNIAPMRQIWINDLRKSCADYFSDINFIIVYGNSKDDEFKSEIREEYKSRVFSLSKKFSYIDLLLPFKRDNNEEVEAEEFRASLSKIDLFFNSTEDKPSYEDMKENIVNSREKLKKLLKKEWDETKSLKEID